MTKDGALKEWLRHGFEYVSEHNLIELRKDINMELCRRSTNDNVDKVANAIDRLQQEQAVCEDVNKHRNLGAQIRGMVTALNLINS